MSELWAALFEASKHFPTLSKDAVNPYFESRYTSYGSMKSVIDPILDKHGLKVVQFPSHVGERPALRTRLQHVSGEFEEDTTVLAMSKNDPQAQGSAVTYMRRYAYAAILGLVSDEDDDGHKATHVDPVTELKDKIKAAAIKAGVKGKDVAEKFAQANPGQSYSTSKDVEAFTLLLEHLEGK